MKKDKVTYEIDSISTENQKDAVDILMDDPKMKTTTRDKTSEFLINSTNYLNHYVNDFERFVAVRLEPKNNKEEKYLASLTTSIIISFNNYLSDVLIKHRKSVLDISLSRNEANKLLELYKEQLNKHLKEEDKIK